MTNYEQDKVKWKDIQALLLFDKQGKAVVVMKDYRPQGADLIVLDETFPLPYRNPYEEDMSVAEFCSQFEGFADKVAYRKSEVKDMMRFVLGEGR